MTILSTDLIGVEGGEAAAGGRTYVATYRTISDTKADGPVQHRAGLPAMGTPYASDAFAVVTSYNGPSYESADQGLRFIYLTRVNYSTISGDRCQTDLEVDPLNLPPIIKGGALKEQVPARKDQGGQEIVNAANDPFDDLFQDESRQELIIQQNQASIDLAQFREFANSVNLNAFFGLASGIWKMDAPSWEIKYRGTCVPYYVVTYRFYASDKDEGWGLVPANLGLRVRQAAAPAGVVDRPKDDEGNPYTPSVPVKLRNDGTQAASGESVIYYDGGTVGLWPIVGPYFVYPLKDFALLGIPTALP